MNEYDVWKPLINLKKIWSMIIIKLLPQSIKLKHDKSWLSQSLLQNLWKKTKQQYLILTDYKKIQQNFLYVIKLKCDLRKNQ